uniref:Uncharacterized protein n=1 Tax=Ignisphaera aggregans TaxID=334771 RepID=A0A7C5XLS8_9CREN
MTGRSGFISALRRYIYLIYLSLGLLLTSLAILFMVWSIGYMERAFIATSLITLLIGFTLLSSGLYLLRLSAYIYASEKGV